MPKRLIHNIFGGGGVNEQGQEHYPRYTYAVDTISGGVCRWREE